MLVFAFQAQNGWGPGSPNDHLCSYVPALESCSVSAGKAIGMGQCWSIVSAEYIGCIGPPPVGHVA